MVFVGVDDERKFIERLFCFAFWSAFHVSGIKSLFLPSAFSISISITEPTIKCDGVHLRTIILGKKCFLTAVSCESDGLSIDLLFMFASLPVFFPFNKAKKTLNVAFSLSLPLLVLFWRIDFSMSMRQQT